MKPPVADLVSDREAKTSFHGGVFVRIKRLIDEYFSRPDPQSPQDLWIVACHWDAQLFVQIVEIE